MSWKKRLLPCWLIVMALRLSAQLPDGSVAPDFMAQDIWGQNHHLYDILDSGKIVVIEISATWCAPCWVYHTSHYLQDLYDAHGPAGDDKLRVFWVEGDPSTNINCIFGPAGCNGGSAGDYTSGVTYPILDNAGIAADYQITYYPTLFIICPNKKVYEVDPLNAEGLWEKAVECPVTLGANNAGIFQYDPGSALTEICGTQMMGPTFALTNLGSMPLTQASIELKWNNNTVQNLQWTGNLPTYGEAQIYLDNQNISTAGTLKTTILNINNGTGDEDFSNNVQNHHFTLAQSFNSTQVLLKIRTDNYGNETYWEVRDESGAVLEFGGNQDVGPYGGGGFPLGVPTGPGSYPNLTIIRDTLHLPANGCYSIHFSDAYGDGMCCDFGTGYYRLYNLDNPGLALISGGEFDDYSRRAFGASGVSATNNLLQNIDIQLFPNPVSDFLTIDVESPAGLEISAQVFSALGQRQYDFPTEPVHISGNVWRLSVADWPQGLYFLQVQLDGQRITKTFQVQH